jgi:hypothetical protein
MVTDTQARGVMHMHLTLEQILNLPVVPVHTPPYDTNDAIAYMARYFVRPTDQG